MFLRQFIAATTFALIATPSVATPFAEMFPGVIEQMPEEIRPGLEKMDLKQGKVFLGGSIATLDVPQGYYFLAPDDASFVLSTLWGNPEDEGTLGMLFPRAFSPLDDTAWGIEVSFDDIGYVSDEDAGQYDYAALLKDMQADSADANEWRRQNGYPDVTLVGWAAEPRYDREARKLYWAKRLQFGDNPVETLNYNIRALGRSGVLVMNFIAGMEQLPAVEAAVPDVLAMVSFTEGNRYTDFDPGIDKVAAVGIGGLIVGKVLAKTGFLAVGLLLLKKFWFLLLLPLVGLKRLFGGRSTS